MLKAGVDVMGTMTVEFKGGHEPAIKATIVDKTCDIGIARTETVERMISNGEFTAADIFTIGNQGAALGFPQRLTTVLYPEWPLASLAHVPREIEQLVAVPLLNLENTDPQPVSGAYAGFTFPYSYEPVRSMLIALDSEGTGHCDPGMYRQGNNPGLCYACPAGSMSASGLGACELCPSGTWNNGTANRGCGHCPDGLTSPTGSSSQDMCEPKEDFPIVLVGIILGSVLGVLLVSCVLWQWIKAVRKSHALEKDRANTIIHQIEEAQGFANELRTPFVLMRANDFMEMGQLWSQEELRAEGCLVYLDTLGEATQFLSPHTSIFFSHQWLGWHHPDPDCVQYKVCDPNTFKLDCAAISALIAS